MLSHNTPLIFVLMAKTGKSFGEIQEGLQLIDSALDLLDRAPDRGFNISQSGRHEPPKSELIQSPSLEKEK